MCSGWLGDGAHHLAKPGMGGILVDAPIPDHLELQVAQFSECAEIAYAIRVGKVEESNMRRTHRIAATARTEGS